MRTSGRVGHRNADVLSATAILLAVFGLFFAGCGDDGGDTDPTDDTSQVADFTDQDQQADIADVPVELCDADLIRAAIGPIDAASTASVTTVEDATTSSFTTTVVVPWDGAADAPYVYLRLLEGTQVPLTDEEALTSEFWDMAIRGSVVRLNGGVSGPATVEATGLNAVDFGGVTVDTPLGDFTMDAVNGTCATAEEAASLLETAVGTWWTAESSADAPAVAQKVYVIRRLDGDLIKLQITGFVATGTDATYTIVWGPLDTVPACDYGTAVHEALQPIASVSSGDVTVTPGTPTTATINARAGGFSAAANNPFVYVDIDGGAKVAITDVESLSDATWDIAFKRSQIRINGGDSGPGGVRVARVSAASLDEVTTMPADSAFLIDDFVDENCEILRNQIGLALTAMADWYEYTIDHQTVPQAYVYVIETTEGAAFKLRFLSWTDGTYEAEWAPMP